jgi:ATP-dependent Clp protease protease subunit
MIHGIQFGFPPHSKTESETYLNFLERENKYVLNILSKHTGRPYEEVAKDCSKDLFLDAKEALDYGIVDHII